MFSYPPGYEIMDEDVIAIARLRSEGLRDLNIPKCCIVEGDTFEVGRTSPGFVDMVSWQFLVYLHDYRSKNTVIYFKSVNHNIYSNAISIINY